MGALAPATYPIARGMHTTTTIFVNDLELSTIASAACERLPHGKLANEGVFASTIPMVQFACADIKLADVASLLGAVPMRNGFPVTTRLTATLCG